MADGITREEKLAAGLKKLKQFQQRAAKAKEAKKKTTKMKNDCDGSNSKGTGEGEPMQNESKVPSESPELDNNLEQLRNISSSSSELSNSASIGGLSGMAQKEAASVVKSKSDLDLTEVREVSSTESLRQISQQVNGLMSESHALLNGSIDQDLPSNSEQNSLGQRNQELAVMVNNLQQSNDQFQFQIEELKAKNKRLCRDFEQEKQQLRDKSHKEQVTLKDQLQVHIQTIGILVAEKTELQSSLSLSQQTAKQKAGEVEELQGRLRASRQRASDLERDLNSLSNSSQQLEKVNKELCRDTERLKLENYKLNKLADELKHANTELSEKLSKKLSEMQTLEKELSGCRSQLSAAEVQVQQLSEQENTDQLESAYQQKLELEKRVALHKESIDKLINERDQMSEQYQQYIQQLSQQVTSLRDEIQQLNTEKDHLHKENTALEEKLEGLQYPEDVNKEDNSELKVQLSVLENQKFELNKQLENKAENIVELSETLEKKENKIAELEKTISRLKEDQVDKGRLAEAMQSDKVAASRAVTQNRELKKQLEELQSGFVSMSNDKLQLAEKLHAEQHIAKELGERLTQQEEELQELREQLSQKEEDLRNLHKDNTKGMYQQNQIADRMRHYEAQGQLTDMLQKELQQAQDQINELVKQNSELRMAIATQAGAAMNDKEERDKRNDLVASLSASVCQLEMERNQMMKQLEEQKTHRTNLEVQMKQKEIQINADEITNNDVVSKEEYAMMKNAMQQLEERFKQTMNKIAELSEERQQLEHLVMQLQGETDTIGDYIALYQIQRGLMRKRATEKDDYIALLAREREDLKAKLSELQGLVLRLVEERKQFENQDADLDLNPALLGMTNSSQKEVVLASEDNVNGDGIIHDSDALTPTVPGSPKPEATEKKIMDLLTEIGTTNLVEKPVMDNFHPCPLCSGRLITV